MTRINLIPVEELSDQHLMAEYRELPRIVNGVLEEKFTSVNRSPHYKLGTGHVIFFTDKIIFLAERYHRIFRELKYRGFELNPEFTPGDMLEKIKRRSYREDTQYVFSAQEVDLSRRRIIEKITQKPLWYKWTHRKRPDYALKSSRGYDGQP